MLTIEEQIERIADEAFERASRPVRAPRRWPAMAAAAVVLLAAGSVVWAVSSRDEDAGSAIAPGPAPTSPGTESALPSSDIESVVVEPLDDPRVQSSSGTIRVAVGEALVLVGMPVVNDSGLVGKVLSVDDGIASVQLVTADGFSIGAAAELGSESRSTGVAFGTGNPDQVSFRRVEDSEAETEIPLGTIVVTAGGTNSISPSGIPIGSVASSSSTSKPSARDNALDPSWDDAPDSELRILLYVPRHSTTSLPETPSEAAASPAALELVDPSSFGLVEFDDPDATKAVFCSRYSQSLHAECEAFTGTARRSYSDPELPDAPFTVDVTTAFVEDPPTDLNTVFYAPGEITSPTQVVVRGTSGELSLDIDGREVIVWEERPGAIARVTFENRPADINPIEIANALIDDPGQPDEVPYVAIELRGSGGDGTLRSLVVMHREGAAECLSVDWVTAGNHFGSCTTEPLTWWSTVSSLEPGVRGDRDVVFGLVPSDATQVELSVDGEVITLDTTGVPGFSHRAWAYVIPTQQGTRFSATLTAGSNQVQVDFVHPIVNVDDLCAAVDYGAVVPPVVGLPMYEAADALRAAGVVLADRLRGDPEQVVLAQNPSAGTEVGCGDTQLTVGAPPTDDTQTSTSEAVAGRDAAVDPVKICGTYTVSAGDFPKAVADRLGVSLESLTTANADNSSYDSWLVDSVISVPCGPER